MASRSPANRHSDELREWIAGLWTSGRTAREIESLSKGQITRSAVCGLVNRMGLHREQGRGAAQRPQVRRAPKAVEPEKRKKPVVRKLAADLPPLPAAEHSDRPCEWRYGDGAEATVCGRVRDPDDWRARYCVDHRAAAVRPKKGGAIVLTPRAAPDLSQARFAGPFHFGGRR